MDFIEFPGENVLVVGNSKNEDVQRCIKNSVQLENIDDFSNLQGKDFSASVVSLDEKPLTDSLIRQIFQATKPGARLAVFQVANVDDATFLLQTNGFTNVETKLGATGTHLLACKPKYEVGSSAKINLKKAAVWKIDDDLGEEEDIIDPDNLLDDDDLKKPDPTTLRVCGTTGKRKACKDCSCGLADELANEKQVQDAPKSSCGSCYLGDAFRCASCPYLGMPAFKPGEKIQLADNLLKADI